MTANVLTFPVNRPPTPGALRLSADQQRALDQIEAVLARGEREAILVGAAGTGKTTVLRALLGRLRDREVTLACPTWKAALRLNEVTGWPTTSIHRLIYGPPVERSKEEKARLEALKQRARQLGQEATEVDDTELVFMLGDFITGKLPWGSLLVVDEASMVNEQVYGDVLKVARENGAQVLWVGDKEQLEPVRGTWGPPLRAADAVLQKVHRQAEGSPILGLASAIRHNRVGAFDGYDPDTCRWERRLSERAVLDFFRETVGRGEDAVAICYTNARRHQLNRQARRALSLHRGPCLTPGEPLLSFSGRGGLVNGEIVQVVSVTPEPPPLLSELELEVDVWQARVRQGGLVRDVCVLPEALKGRSKEARKEALAKFDRAVDEALAEPWWWGGTSVRADQLKREKARVVDVDYGYACTCHKAQGSQWPHVLVVVDRAFRRAASQESERGGGGPDFARRWLYTAVTRAQQRLLVGSVDLDSRASRTARGGRRS